jgi:hypothetical protein
LLLRSALRRSFAAPVAKRSARQKSYDVGRSARAHFRRPGSSRGMLPQASGIALPRADEWFALLG